MTERKSKADVIAQLRQMAGTPSEMAAAVGVEASDRTFSRAIADLEEDGTLVAEGKTRNRRYRNTTLPDRGDSQRKARICPKCNDRQFGNLDWVCPEHGVAVDQEDNTYFGELPSGVVRGTPDQWAAASAKVAKGGKTIGHVAKGA